MPSLSASVAERRAELYGPGRVKELQHVQSVLKKTNIFQGGEYNFNQTRESDGIYKSSNSRDYSGAAVNRDPLSRDAVSAFQNDVHFENRTNDHIPEGTYKISATHTDFDSKATSKPKVLKEDRTVRWPDMAPQFATNRAIGDSEYTTTFLGEVLPANLPLFPLVDTSRLVVPVDLDKKRLNKKVHLSIGTDPDTNYESEAVRAFTRSAPLAGRGDDPFMLRPLMEEAKRVTRSMREMELASNVFKDGDYNNLVQGSASVHSMDYGKSLHIASSAGAPSALAVSNMGRPGLEADTGEPQEEGEYDIQGGITRRMPGVIQHALNVHVPNSFKDGSQTKRDSKSAHFQFGTDENPLTSIYTEDYVPTSRREKTIHYSAPKDSQVLARDPAQSAPTLTTTANEFCNKTFEMAVSVNPDQLRAALRNMAYKSKNHFELSYDADNCKGDRQASLGHSDFVAAPVGFRPVPPQREPRSAYNYLDTEVALPHPVPKVKTTSNQYQFTGAFMDPQSSKSRRLMKDELTKSRQKFVLDTHFDIGYELQRHDTSHGEQFTGRALNDRFVPAAGKSDGVPAASRRFRHLKHSENTQDMRPDYSFLYKQDKPLSLEKREASSLPALPIHAASIMKNDYQPLQQRAMTSQQKLMLRQDARLWSRPVAASHFFHTDTSGNNNLRSTQMADFIKPELMSGPTTAIAAR